MRRVSILILAASLTLQSCGPNVDEDAVTLCRDVPQARLAIAQLADRVPSTDDFDVISGALMEIYDITEFLQDWSYVDTDDLNNPVREAARAALSSTGMYSDGTNPITGAELRSNLSSADRRWDGLDTACTELLSG